MNVDIRTIQTQDIPQAAELLHSMWLQHADEASQVLNRDYIATYDVKAYLMRYMNNENNCVFVATIDNNVVGVARVEIKPAAEGMYNFDRYAYFDDLVVASKYQRQGIAKRLTNARIEFAKNQGITACESRVYAHNTAAKAAASASGFNPVYSSYYKFL